MGELKEKDQAVETRAPETEETKKREETRAPEGQEAQGIPGYAERVAKAEPRRKEDILWLEVRPFLGQELRAANYLELINAMHGTGGVFEFLMASGPDPSDLGKAPVPKRVIRYFVRCPDAVTKELAKNILQTSGFAVDERPLRLEGNRLSWWEPGNYMEYLDDQGYLAPYPLEAELELETHYGSKSLFPEVLTNERSFDQFLRVIDSLHAALLSGGAFRVVVKKDDRARVHLQAPTVSRDGRAIGGAVTYHISDFFRGLMSLGRPDGVGEESRRAAPEVDRRAMEEVSKRVSQSWFACDARAYGTQDQIRAIVASLGFPSNRFRVFRHRKQPKPIDPSLQELKSFLRQGATLLPLAFPLLLWWSGLWNPLDILKDVVLVWPVALALLLPLVLRSLWKMRRTVAMTVGELSLLVSVPSKPEAGHFYFAEGKPRVEVKAEPLVQDTSQDMDRGESQEPRTPRAALYPPEE